MRFLTFGGNSSAGNGGPLRAGPLRVAGVFLVLLSLGAAARRSGAQTPPAAPIVLTGRVLAGRTPLPGVSIVASSVALHQRFITASGPDGGFQLRLPRPGRYALRATFAGFAASGQTIDLSASGPTRVLIEMTLAARLRAAGNAQAARLGGELGGPQNLALQASDNGAGSGFNALEEGNAASAAALPGASGGNGAPVDTSTQAVTISGRMGQSSPDALNAARRFRGFRPGEARGGPGGFGGRGGFRGGGPMIFIARSRGGFNFNQPHGSVYYSLADSALDARPYALTGIPSPKPSFVQQRYGIALGSPLVIPKIINSPKTFVFLNVTGNHSKSPFTAFSTVPTLAERGGDFSGATTRGGQPITLYDPASGQPLANDSVAVSPVAQALLPYIPVPNLPGGFQNFYYATTTRTSTDQASLRFMHNFGAGGIGFGRGRGGARNNLSVALRYQGSNEARADALPTIAGTTRSRGIDVNASYARGLGHLTNIVRVGYNRQRVETQNLYAFLQNVAGAAGIGGIADAPFDWGLPSLSFSDFASLNDIAPALTRNQTGSIGEAVIWNRGKHNWRFGGDFRRIQVNPETDANPRGSFVFSGLYTARLVNGAPAPATGNDFADFLLGDAQQAAVNYGAGAEYFRGDSWDLYAQDNWRMRGNLSLNWGLRYEFISPLTEKYNRLADLALQFGTATPGLTAVTPLLAGRPPFATSLPLSLIRPDRDGFEPRVGFAWVPWHDTVLRGGYGINLNTGAYASLATQMAAQPPFATSQTLVGAANGPLPLANAFAAAAGGQITNNFAVDPNYRLGYVQLWNLDLQRQLSPTLLLNLDYSGSKGTDLDQTLAPNRGPAGLLLPGVDAFLWETSGGDSILHAGTVQIRKRLQSGFSFGAAYTWSKSIDDASTIGGGATVVAQNPLDLAAERGLSSFDVRHRFTGDFDYELPWGPERRWLTGDTWAARLFGQWQWSGDFTLATGTPLTPRVLGNAGDVARGTNGTLRPDLTGQPLTVAAPGIAEFFNTAAFALPPSGAFGDAGRNILTGPGTIIFNSALSKTVSLGEFRNLELSLRANNVFNTPQWTGVDAVVNSPTFGRVTGVGSMRTVQVLARYRF